MTRNEIKDQKIRVGITHGDLNGIGYEVIMKALNDARILELFTPVIYGLSRVLSYHRKSMNLNNFNFNIIKPGDQVHQNKINLVNLSNEEVKLEFGKSSQLAGKYAFDALEESVRALKANLIDVVVTAPIDKSTIHSEQFNFPGHTEYYASSFQANEHLMIMVNEQLRIATVTGHIPLKEVPETLTEALIHAKINTLEKSLIMDFGIEKPKMAILGLNPHAGEQGLLGNEDQLLIQPAINRAREEGKLVFGPFPADGFFATEYSKYDAILAMYHDQGLIPFKALAFDGGVNFTAGLSIVRTSPAHGTAYDKAGKNIASPKAMRQAMYLATDVFRNRIRYQEMTKDPLAFGLVNESDKPRSNHNSDPKKRD